MVNRFSLKSTAISLEKQGVGYLKVPVIEVDELVDENFKGSCILRIYQAYIGNTKSISLSVEEILAKRIESRESYFANEVESEDESEESEEENEK